MDLLSTILIVDDDLEIREILKIILQREGFIVQEASNAIEALNVLKESISLIILDIMLPGTSGFELCSIIREITTVPILFLSAKIRDIDKAEGLSRGGDDYLIKPFSSVELISRVKALLRRCFVYHNFQTGDKDTITHMELKMNLNTGEVTIQDEAVDLTSIEYQLLRLLLKNRKKVYSACEIYEYIWQEPFLPLSNNTIMVHIKNIRKKLEKNVNNPQYIRTAWGKGYYIE